MLRGFYEETASVEFKLGPASYTIYKTSPVVETWVRTMVIYGNNAMVISGVCDCVSAFQKENDFSYNNTKLGSDVVHASG